MDVGPMKVGGEDEVESNVLGSMVGEVVWVEVSGLE